MKCRKQVYSCIDTASQLISLAVDCMQALIAASAQAS